MKKHLLSIFFLLFILHSLAQVGIGTDAPKANLHIEASNTSLPSGKDGILIPKVNIFPSVAQAKGQTVFLYDHSSLPDGFYYWNGEDWDSYIIDLIDRTNDETIYVVTGTGYSGSGNTENAVILSTLKAYNTTGFSVSENQITVGKSGNYLISFNSALKKNAGTAYRAVYTYRIKKNATTFLTTSNSITNEETTATSVALSGIVRLNSGDILNVTIQKTAETGSTAYTGYGTNTITLTYLND